MAVGEVIIEEWHQELKRVKCRIDDYKLIDEDKPSTKKKGGRTSGHHTFMRSPGLIR